METKETTIPVRVDEVKLVYQTKTPASQRAKVTSSGDAKNAFLNTWEDRSIEHHESFRILLLNRANRALGIAVVSNGGISVTVIDVRQIFQAAIKSNCSSIIAAHNHPSGNQQPSDADVQITKRISEAGKVMDIKLLDHLILTPSEGHFSFAGQRALDRKKEQVPGRDFPNRCQSGQELPEGQQDQVHQTLPHRTKLIGYVNITATFLPFTFPGVQLGDD